MKAIPLGYYWFYWAEKTHPPAIIKVLESHDEHTQRIYFPTLDPALLDVSKFTLTSYLESNKLIKMSEEEYPAFTFGLL